MLPNTEYSLDKTQVLEFAFAVARIQGEIIKPSWKGFKKLTRPQFLSPESVINYVPIIQHTPTETDVVNHVLEKSGNG